MNRYILLSVILLTIVMFIITVELFQAGNPLGLLTLKLTLILSISTLCLPVKQDN
jgi:hypothetical protein